MSTREAETTNDETYQKHAMTEFIRILHVEDDPDFASMTATYLKDENDHFEIIHALDAASGLERVMAERFDCVISDYDLGGADGIDLLEEVREEFPELPFILFTGKGSEEVASQAISSGVSDYLQKEVRIEQFKVLANRVENVVSQRRAERRAAKQARILTILREINLALLEAETVDDIEESVTEIFARTEPYGLCWFGIYDPDHGRIVPQTVEGENAESVTPRKIRSEHEDEGRELVHADEITVAEELPGLFSFEVDGELSDFEGFAILPIIYHDTRYGFIALYADRVDIFDEDELGMLEEITGDIAQAYHAALALEELRQHQTVVEAVPEGVFVLDENGTIDLINAQAAAIFDRDRNEAIGEPFPQFVEEGIFDADIIEWYLGSVREMLSSASDREEARYVTNVEVGPRGSRTVEIHLTLRPYETEYRGTVGIIRDITEES